MTKTEAIMWFGSQTKLAEFLNIYQSNICGWKKVPIHHQEKIEEHTQGELKADVKFSGRVRYTMFLEKLDLLELKDEAKRQGTTCAHVLRKAIKEYIHCAHYGIKAKKTKD